MAACASAHYWGRENGELRHQKLVSLLRPTYTHGALSLDSYYRSKGLEEMLRRAEIATPFAGPEEAIHKKRPRTSQLGVRL